MTIYKRLVEKAQFAADLEVRDWVRPDDDGVRFDNMVDWVKGLFVDTVTIEGANGEKQFANDESIFNSAELPDRITSVYFDTGARHRGLNQNKNPLHWASVQLDFNKPPRFDLANPVSSPTPNNSNVFVHGSDPSWVDSTFQTVLDLVEDRKNAQIRDWIHGSHVYDVLLWFLVLPLTFAILNKLTEKIALLSLPMIVESELYVYIFAFITILFRFFFSYAKWIWPKIQLEHPRDHSVAHRGWWVAVSAGLSTALIYGWFFSGG